MANKTPDQLTSAASANDTDLLMIYPSGGPLKKLTFSAFLAQVLSGLGGSLLVAANNLSDLVSASSARANLGLGTSATLASSAVCQTANNLSDVASPATARTNLGAAAANAPTITGGITVTGSQKGNVQAVSTTSIDVSISDFFTKSISANTTFTFDNATAGKAQGFCLELTITAGAEPTWPASVEWEGGLEPVFGNGRHVIAFVTFNGGTVWTGLLGALNAAVPA